MRWMPPREELLDEYQRTVLQECRGLRGRNEWIQGFAGSGKTVLVVQLVQKALLEKPDASVCVVVFTYSLRDLIGTGFQDRFKDSVPLVTYPEFVRAGKKYDLVVVDEVQDVPRTVLLRIVELAGRVVVAGDVDQSIFRDGASAEEISAVLQPRPHRLGIVHRLTQTLIRIAAAVLPNAAIHGRSSRLTRDVKVTLAKATSTTEEFDWVWRQCCRYARQGEPAAVLLPKHGSVQEFISTVCRLAGAGSPTFPKRENEGDSGWTGTDYGPANALLERGGVPLQYLGNNYGRLLDSDKRPLTYVMTYHSAKGLDFETVFLPQLNSNQVFWRGDGDIDQRLFFVGVTRSRNNLLMSYSASKPHRYVQAMPQDLLHLEDCASRQQRDAEPEYFF